MICPREKRTFSSENLDLMVYLWCTYSNNFMVESAVKRFIGGRSSAEISSLMGISEGHARKLSNQALEIFSEIHEDNGAKLSRSMNSYILQIDGTTDSEFSMIVAVNDSMTICYFCSTVNFSDICITIFHWSVQEICKPPPDSP